MKKKVTIWKVLLWIVFLPIMAIIAIWKGKMKPFWKLVLTVIILAVCFGMTNSGNQAETDAADSTTKSLGSEEKTDSGFPEQAIAVELAQSEIVTTEGDDFILSYSVTPEDTIASKVSFIIADEEIVSHKSENAFSAVKPGKTSITVLCGESQARCDIIVEPAFVPITSVVLSRDSYEIPVGGSFVIDYSFEPQYADDSDMVFSASNGLVEIDKRTVVSKAAGDTEITLSQNDTVLATLTVHSYTIDAESIVFDESTSAAWIGRSIRIPVTITPADATWELIQFRSSDPNVLQIEGASEQGYIMATGVSSGTAAIIASYCGGEKEQSSELITVSEVMPSDFRIVSDPPVIQIGDHGSFTVEFEPEDVTDKSVVWKSNNPNIINVSPDGAFDAVAIGSASISATHKSGVSSTEPVEILPVEAKQIRITSSWSGEEKFIKGKQLTLSAVFEPSNTTNQHVVWSSDDETIAKVNERGIVTAVAPGKVNICATADNGVTGRFPLVVDITPQKFYVTITATMTENDHVGNNWSREFFLNSDAIRSGSYILITPGDDFSITAEITDNDSDPDTGRSTQKNTLSNEMCSEGFSYEAEIGVRENGGRYSGHYAYWTVSMKFTPVN